MTNLLTTIKTAALTAGYSYFFGDGRYFEDSIQQAELIADQYGLMFNLISCNPRFENRQFNGELEYSVQFFMFRKFEAYTSSTLNETIEQKFEARMEAIQEELLKFFFQLSQCTDDIDVLNANLTPGQNVTAANVDGWFLDCKLKLFNQYPIL